MSDRPTSGITVDKWADDLKAVLDEIGIKKTHIFGESNGSPIVVRFAAKYPEATGAIIHFGQYKDSDSACKVSNICAKIIDEYGTGRLGCYYLVRIFGIPPPYEDWEVRRFEENISPASWKAMQEALHTADLTQDVGRIKSTQLVLMGDSGPFGEIGAELWEEITKLTPNAERKIIPGTQGTYCVIEKPGEVAQVVIDFLSRHKIR